MISSLMLMVLVVAALVLTCYGCVKAATDGDDPTI